MKNAVKGILTVVEPKNAVNDVWIQTILRDAKPYLNKTRFNVVKTTEVWPRRRTLRCQSWSSASARSCPVWWWAPRRSRPGRTPAASSAEAWWAPTWSRACRWWRWSRACRRPRCGAGGKEWVTQEDTAETRNYPVVSLVSPVKNLQWTSLIVAEKKKDSQNVCIIVKRCILCKTDFINIFSQ